MTMTCTVCKHENREQIDKDLVEGKPYRSIARQSGASPSAVLRHRNEHLPRTLARSKEARELANADSLIAQMRDLNRRTVAILNKAEKAGNQEVALKAIGEVRRNQELIGKLLGELGRARTPPAKERHLHIHGNDAVRAFVLASGRLPSSDEMERLTGPEGENSGIESVKEHEDGK